MNVIQKLTQIREKNQELLRQRAARLQRSRMRDQEELSAAVGLIETALEGFERESMSYGTGFAVVVYTWSSFKQVFVKIEWVEGKIRLADDMPEEPHRALKVHVYWANQDPEFTCSPTQFVDEFAKFMARNALTPTNEARLKC